MKESKATEALRVATDIAAIKAALRKRGYRLRKQAKQPVWKVLTPLNPPLSRGETGEQESSLLARGETLFSGESKFSCSLPLARGGLGRGYSSN
ncbi:MAG: hypothetical protein AB1589_08610 [Cyanobacteriota bacterium]